MNEKSEKRASHGQGRTPAPRIITAPFKDAARDAIALFHIGKTGGTFLKTILAENRGAAPYRVVLLRHVHTLEMVDRFMGPEARIAFVFRDPAARFVSGFLSRQRQGRPTYASMWSPGEATAFAFFRSPDALARGLGSDDETEKSMACFAMKTITHLDRNYRFHFGPPEAFDRLEGRVAACVDQAELDAQLEGFLARLGITAPVYPEERRHETPGGGTGLSEAGLACLKAFWADEFALYDRMRALAARMW